MSGPPLGEGGYPPWDIHLIHYECSPQRTDLLLRASHVIGDGQLFMRLIKAVLDEEPTAASTLADKQLAKEQQHQQQLLHLDSELISSDDKIPVGTVPHKGPGGGEEVGVTGVTYTSSSRGGSDMGCSPPDSPEGRSPGAYDSSSRGSSSNSGSSMRSSSSGGSLYEAAEGGVEGGVAAGAAGGRLGDESVVLNQQQRHEKQQDKGFEGIPCQEEVRGEEEVVQQQQQGQHQKHKKGRGRKKLLGTLLWR